MHNAHKILAAIGDDNVRGKMKKEGGEPLQKKSSKKMCQQKKNFEVDWCKKKIKKIQEKIMEWRQVVHFEVRGWDGFTTWASCDADGVVRVWRRMIHPDGTLHFVNLTEDKHGFMLSLAVQRGVHNGGHTVVARQRAMRVLAYALDVVPFDKYDMAAATKYEALRINDRLPLSFDNVDWYLKGETQRRGIRVSEDSARDTEQKELENEVFANVKCRLYDMNGGILDTWVNEDGKFQVSTLGRVRYVLGDNGVFHYTKGTMDGNGYLHVSMSRFAIGRRMMVHVLVMHTFVGFPDDLGYNPCVTSVDHRSDRTRSNNKLENLQYANGSMQGINRGIVLQKYGVDNLEDLPQDVLVRAEQHMRLKPDESLTHLESRAREHLKDVPFAAVQMFLRGKRLCDLSEDEVKSVKQIGECMFIFEYQEVEDIFNKTDWVFPYDNWKELDVKLMVPRDRIKSIRKALDAVNVMLDWDAIYKDDRKCIRLQLLFNRVMMYHHHLTKFATTSCMSLKRSRNDDFDEQM